MNAPESNVLPVAAARERLDNVFRKWGSGLDYELARDAFEHAVAAAALPDAYELAEQLIHDPKWQEGHDFHCVWQAAAALGSTHKEFECLCGHDEDAHQLICNACPEAEPAVVDDCVACSHTYHGEDSCRATVSHDAGVPGKCGCRGA